MTYYVNKGIADGKITPPASKSMAHRLLILAALCKDGVSLIKRITPSDDLLATIDCLRALGVKIEYENNSAKVYGIDFKEINFSAPLNCRESGSTLRLLIPLAMLSEDSVSFIGSERLMERPQDVYEKIAEDRAITFLRNKKSITVGGRLCAGRYVIEGNISSQFISGLLIALSTLDGDSEIIFSTPIESRPYVELTLWAMEKFGVYVYKKENGSLLIKGAQKYTPCRITVEGDWSAGAVFEALNHMGSQVRMEGLNENSLQADRQCRKYFELLDRGFCEIDISDCPDLGPILFTLAAVKHGGRFIGTKRLRDKESDRIFSMQSELRRFGCELICEDNSVTVKKCYLHSPVERIFGHNDHRIIMAMAVLCTLYGGIIEGCEAVYKSYPSFFEDLQKLGIAVEEID